MYCKESPSKTIYGHGALSNLGTTTTHAGPAPFDAEWWRRVAASVSLQRRQNLPRVCPYVNGRLAPDAEALPIMTGRHNALVVLRAPLASCPPPTPCP